MEDRELLIPFQKIYNWMEDEESKEIFLNRLSFVISRDYNYMYKIISKYVPDMAVLNDEAIPALLNQLPYDKDFYLYGAGEDALANLHYFVKDARFRGFCDQDKQKQKDGVEGYAVISPEAIIQTKDSSIVISTHRGLEAIKKYLISNGIDRTRIFIMSNYMFATQKEQYFNPSFMTFEDEEVFIDAGCCDMITSRRLKLHCKKLKRVYAFEPDKRNYEICKKIAQDEFDDGVVRVFCKGTWSENTTLYFEASNDGASHISDQGKDSIEVIKIDDVVDPFERVTFIKMDVEGSELESLKGAEQTIRRDKPKLAICIYHKAEDMYQLPLYIKELVPEYRLYLRHHSNGDGETVLYAMP